MKDKPKRRNLISKENIHPEKSEQKSKQTLSVDPPATNNSKITSKYKVLKSSDRNSSPGLSSSSFSTTTHEDSKNFKNGEVQNRTVSPEVYKPQTPPPIKRENRKTVKEKPINNKPEKPKKPKNTPIAKIPENKSMNRYNLQEFPPPPPSSVLKATKSVGTDENIKAHQAVVTNRAQTYTQNSQTTRNPSGSALTNERGGYTSQDSQHGSSGYASVTKNKERTVITAQTNNINSTAQNKVSIEM